MRFTDTRPLAEGRDLQAEWDTVMLQPRSRERSMRLHAIWRAHWGAHTTPQPIDPIPQPSLNEIMAKLDACVEWINTRFLRTEHSARRCPHGMNLERAHCATCAPITGDRA